MSKLLEIFGRAITVDVADLILESLNKSRPPRDNNKSAQYRRLDGIIELMVELKLDATQDQLKLYLFDNPSCSHGRLAAAAICLYKNKLNDAIEQLNSVYMGQPANTLSLYALGHCYERIGKESQAIEFYQDCLKFKNYLQFPAQRLAAIYLKNGQLEKTIKQYELLKQQYPDDMSILVTLGYLYIASAQYDRAIETFNTAILIHPDNFIIEDESIDQLIQDGQLNDALQLIEDLLQQQPNRVELISKYADVLDMLGATAEAASQYQQALRLCPDFLEATIKLGTQYLNMKAEQLAAQQFNKAVEINDRIVDAYIGLATAQKLSGIVTDALATLSLAAAIQPNSSFLFAESANLLFQTVFGDSGLNYWGYNSTAIIELVIQAHHNETKRRPHNPDIYYRLGLLLMSITRLSDAIKAFQVALDINPTFDRARTKLAVCYFEMGQRENALNQLSSDLYFDKETFELYYKTALLYCDKLKFASSLMNLDHFMEQNFSHFEPSFNISIVLQNLGLLDRVSLMWENLFDTAKYALSVNTS